MTSLRKVMIFCAFAAASASFAHATPITPGGPAVTATNAITVTNDGTVGSISGTLSAPTFTGTYTELVIRDGSNPYGNDRLTFLITVSSDASSANGIEQISAGDGPGSFGRFPTVNVGYLAGAGEKGTDVPLTILETDYGTVAFDFTNTDAIAPGTGTQYLVIQTAATDFTTGYIGAIDSSTSTVDGYVPVGPTPEPSSLALLGTGLIGGTSILLRRRRTVAL
jgi:hypothetical protein